MVIYPPSSRARFEQPQWATQSNTAEKEVTFTQQPIEYEVTSVDSQTTNHEAYRAAEISADTINKEFFVRFTSDITACRQLTLNPKV